LEEQKKPMINYAVRNLTTLDEEQVRLLEDPEEYVKAWREELSTKKMVKQIRRAAKLFNNHEDSAKVDSTLEDLRLKLLPHIDKPELYEKNYTLWEDWVLEDEERYKEDLAEAKNFEPPNDEEQRVGHIEKEVMLLVTIGGRPEWMSLEKASTELGTSILEETMLEAVHFVQDLLK
jgi:hypothetical protein